ncbi:ECF RNA polymerase sigma factor SigE [Pelotomaculum schinkii]|uniref:ECF RNA polymerase sigma factor SigE n=1 Tax=Pelotomaculum schinkii TaxID=78350 RepID=A0A4Y7RAI4_9FIRM|nr:MULTISPECIES: sigma-70 family RNA polymerase sigma factor [Pelotomaculum]TEB05683.1 ECF RNA polymerase sigma factor SigE [Pelotomaculum schinkii]TEB14109.1 ECF RNA polymerase sigma factor SigE [Pelotomaculum sp. FP]
MDFESQCTATIASVVREYADMVYRLAFAQVRSKSDADDIFQEVFLRYVRNNPAFVSEEHRKAWLIRVTINCAKKYWSSAWQRNTVPLDDNYRFLMPEENELDEVLRKLAPKYRSVIHLYYYEGYSISEIGKILSIKESTVRTQLTRARTQLSNMLKGEI